MKVTLEMPIISKCMVDACAYNVEKRCHAKAITVGDGARPGCDTFFQNASHCHNVKQVAGVGACKVAVCKHNQDFQCGAGQIQVGYSGDDVLCLTYQKK